MKRSGAPPSHAVESRPGPGSGPSARPAVILTHRQSLCAVIVSALQLAACATPIADAAVRPLRDLNLVHTDPPAALVDVVAAPYAPPSPDDCEGAAAELAALDAALGEDIDSAPSSTSSGPTALLQDAIQGLADLPYRNVLRQLSGAAAADRAWAKAILAGMVRRGFLKGLSQGRGCPNPGPA